MKIILLFLCCMHSLYAMESSPSNEKSLVEQLVIGFKQLAKEDQVIVTTALETKLSFYQKILQLNKNNDEQWCEEFSSQLLGESEELKKLEQYYEKETPAASKLLEKYEKEVNKFVISFDKINEKFKERFFEEKNIQAGDWEKFSPEVRQAHITAILIKCKAPLEEMATRRLSLTTTCLEKIKAMNKHAAQSPVTQQVKKKKKKKRSNQSWG